MVEGTRFKDLEKVVLGLKQHQELQEKWMEDHQSHWRF